MVRSACALLVISLSAFAQNQRVSIQEASTLDRVDINRVMPPLQRGTRALTPYAPGAGILGGGDAQSGFAEFVIQSQALTFENLSRSKQVRENEKFLVMRKYFDNAFSGLSVNRSITVGEQVFDCIPLREQPSLRTGNDVDAAPEADSGSGAPEHLILGRPDAKCDPGFIPFKRTNLQILTSYETLGDFLSKDKGISRRNGFGNYRFRLSPPLPNAAIRPEQPGGDRHIH